MEFATLLRKDLREHGVLALLLAGGFILAVQISLSQNSSGSFSMSPLEVVRFSLLSIIPLIAFIVGNRLIVREYLDKTRLFVEALPVNNLTLVVTKYITGLIYLLLLALVVVIFASLAASAGDDIDQRYFFLILLKTMSFVGLIWSVVFCFSFCGYLRPALFIVLIGAILILISHPGIDQGILGPFALMDGQVFTFERYEIPWQDLIETLLFTVGFTVAGFVLALMNEGSVAESLAKPLSRRDAVAMFILIFAGITVYATVLENRRIVPYAFTGSAVVRYQDPPVSVLYLEQEYQKKSNQLLDSLVSTVIAAQATLGIDELPRIRLSLDTGVEPNEIEIDSVGGVLLRADFREYGSYAESVLQAAVLHSVFQHLTNQRMSFEPNHWLLDGFSRWLSEAQVATRLSESVAQEHHAQLIARALYTHRLLAPDVNLMHRWQQIADFAGYPSAEALAYSAIVFLEQEHGRETVVRLGSDFLTESVGSSTLASIKTRLRPMQARFEELTDESWLSFHAKWQSWLEQQSSVHDVMVHLNNLPGMSGRVSTSQDQQGASQILATFDIGGLTAEQSKGGAADAGNTCIVRHAQVSAFDSEVSPDAMARRSVFSCGSVANDLGQVELVVKGPYGPGDRVYLALEYQTKAFFQPLPLWAGRVILP